MGATATDSEPTQDVDSAGVYEISVEDFEARAPRRPREKDGPSGASDVDG